MRKITKLLTLALAALMIMGAMPVSAAFADVSVDDAALYDAVELLTTLGVAKGTSETEFSPEALVTRQQMAAFVYRLMKAGRSSEGGVNTTPFTDLEDSTFFNMISWANTAGIIKGTSATTFNPKGNITLQDAYVMVVRALGYEKDGALAYPFGYVDQAEAIGLDEDIPSTVDYTDNLTRGQVAIILKNAFYADMNEKTVDYKWVRDDKEGGSGEAAYVAFETAETIANKIFGVVEETLVVKATAHYGYDRVDATASETQDIDTLIGTRYDEDGNMVGTENATFKMSDLKLEGSSDDYFLAEITLFVKKAKEVKDDVVIAAKSNLIKKTVTAADVVIDRSTKTDDKYYVDEDKNNEKVMTGLVTFGGVKAYLDANAAPSSYKTLGNANTDAETDKRAVQFIKLSGGEYTEDFATFEYANETGYTFTYNKDDHDALTAAFNTKFPTVYNNGLYEADVYDVNGDGYAEYVFVKDYVFFQMLDKKNNNVALVNDTLSYKDIDATIEGAEFADKDYVLAYFNSAANYVKVAEVIKPFTEMVTSKSNKAKADVVTFANGTKVDFFNADNKFADYTFKTKYVTENAYDSNKALDEEFDAGKSYTVYAKDGIVLFVDGSTSTEFDTTADYAIVLDATDDADYVKAQSKVVDGEYKEVYFVKAVIDGAVKTVQLADTAKVFNKYDEDTGAATNETKLDKATTHKIKSEKQANAIAAELYGKFSTFTKTEDGAYVFTALNFVDAKNVTGDDIKTAFEDLENENAVYYGTNGGANRTATIKHFSGSIYEVTSGNLTGISKFNVKDYSKLIIESKDEDNEKVYTVYDASNLSKFDNTVFDNVKAVFINNTKSDVENLGILFAYVDNFETTEAKEYRIVIEETIIVDKNNEAKNVYTVIDLAGNKTEDVEADDEYVYVEGGFVALDKDGAIKSSVTDTSYVENRLFEATFEDYDAENNFLTIKEDGNTYVLAEDAKILVYKDADKIFTAEEDVLTLVEDDIAYDELDGVDALELHIIAEDDEDNEEIKHVKTLVVVPVFN